MNLFKMLQAVSNRITPENCKVHLATHNGTDNPLDVYYSGKFDEWQSWQQQRNFSRDHVVSLIQLPGDSRWLFVGCYLKHGHAVHNGEGYSYNLEFLDEYRELAGRLIVCFQRPGRQPYIYGENVLTASVAALLEQRMSVSEFAGFKNVRVPFGHLETIVRTQEPTWRGALSSVAGIYIITDPGVNKFYVGSAYGIGGIWGRWSQYVDGHGNNKMLKELVQAEGIKRAEHFWFSILEIADIQTDPTDVIARENHWKEVLLTRQAGYNASEGGKGAKAEGEVEVESAESTPSP
jgi:hypothetical protein